jgi:hypothetical protein
MPNIKSFFDNQSGVISFELVAFTSIIIFLTMFSALAAQHIRFNNEIERTAGTMADILINQKIDNENNILLDIIRSQSLSSYVSVSAMLGIDPAITDFGIRATYLNNTQKDNDGNFLPEILFQQGRKCSNTIFKSPIQYLDNFAKELTDEVDELYFELIMVEVCANRPLWTLKGLIFPNNYSSFFISSRKI